MPPAPATAAATSDDVAVPRIAESARLSLSANAGLRDSRMGSGRSAQGAAAAEEEEEEAGAEAGPLPPPRPDAGAAVAGAVFDPSPPPSSSDSSISASSAFTTSSTDRHAISTSLASMLDAKSKSGGHVSVASRSE